MLRSLSTGLMAPILMLAPSPAFTRVVDYALDPSVLIANGVELKITPLTTDLLPKVRIEAAADAPGLTHYTLGLGGYCSAYKIENPVPKLIETTANEWNGATSLAAMAKPVTEAVRLTVTGASSYRRCVEVSEMNVRCITKMRLTGMIDATVDGQAAALPVKGEAERDASVGGFCEGMAKGIAVVGREAAIALMLDAEQKALAAQATASNPTPSSATH